MRTYRVTMLMRCEADSDCRELIEESKLDDLTALKIESIRQNCRG